MRVDELQRDLRSARDDQLAADGVAGRQGVDRYVRRARTQRTSLAVVIVLVLVSAGVFLATRGTDEQRVISGPDDVPHYLPDPLPGGSCVLPTATRSRNRSMSGPRASVEPSRSRASHPTIQRGLIGVDPDCPRIVGYQEPSARQVSICGETSHCFLDRRRAQLRTARPRVPEEDFRAAASSAGVDENGRAHLVAPPGYREVRARAVPAAHRRHGAVGPLVGDSGYVIRFDQDKAAPDSPYVGGRSLVVAAWPRSHAWMLMSKRLEPTEVRGHAGISVASHGRQPVGIVRWSGRCRAGG